jgi:hypothetical protein
MGAYPVHLQGYGFLGRVAAESPQLQAPRHRTNGKAGNKTALSGKWLFGCFALVPR